MKKKAKPTSTVPLTKSYLKTFGRGGKRKGAGRPKTKEDTVVMRVPVSLVSKVKEMIVKHGKKRER